MYAPSDTVRCAPAFNRGSRAPNNLSYACIHMQRSVAQTPRLWGGLSGLQTLDLDSEGLSLPGPRRLLLVSSGSRGGSLTESVFSMLASTCCCSWCIVCRSEIACLRFPRWGQRWDPGADGLTAQRAPSGRTGAGFLGDLPHGADALPVAILASPTLVYHQNAECSGLAAFVDVFLFAPVTLAILVRRRSSSLFSQVCWFGTATGLTRGATLVAQKRAFGYVFRRNSVPYFLAGNEHVSSES